MQTPLVGLCSVLIFYWIWALKPEQYNWVFFACSLNGLCKVLNCALNFLCRLVVSISHLRQDIGDDPPILASGHFKWRLFQLFHLSISLKSDFPPAARCEAVIVSVPSCPTRRLVFCMWKDLERRRDCWINTQTAFCLHHFGFYCHETQRCRRVDNQRGRGGGRVLGFILCKVKAATPGELDLPEVLLRAIDVFQKRNWFYQTFVRRRGVRKDHIIASFFYLKLKKNSTNK